MEENIVDDKADVVNETDKPLTIGQKLVGLKFNPSGSNEVDNVKQKFADLIDIAVNGQVKAIADKDTNKANFFQNSINGLIYEQMMMVKAITWSN